MDWRRAAPLLLTVLLAGCSQGGGAATPEPAEPAFENLELEATATTGVIRGVIVDEAVRPVANATVTLNSETARETRSNADGAFGFAALEPGTYFLQVTKLGYFPVQQSAEVVAGVAEPPIVKILLQTDAASTPFWQGQVFEGFVECTTSILVLCGAPAILTGQNLTNDRFAWDQYFADNATHLQAEMVWDSTQALSPGLYFEMETLNDGCENSNDDVGSFLNNTQGESPIYATVNQTQIEAWSIGTGCPIWMSVFSLGPVCSPPEPVFGISHCPGFTVEQRFKMYFHTFHGYLPPAGWRFTVDGDPPPPPL
ncbi:MAG TPA: carboxypeptidase regulatory-like domain-containing protein [Candidatus Thermoplasmatota archaeon]|nr:carboxypeptidase regulatory-like domain-containing protein [Candidatus Thermoplasmatota archaeon]